MLDTFKCKREGAPGFEPGTSRSAVECSTTELYPHCQNRCEKMEWFPYFIVLQNLTWTDADFATLKFKFYYKKVARILHSVEYLEFQNVCRLNSEQIYNIT